MFEKIKILKDKGYYPNIVFDIGACHGEWTMNMSRIFDKSSYLMFEAIDYQELNLFKTLRDVKVFNVVLSDKIEEVNWYEMRNSGDSIYKEQTYHFTNCPIIKKQTIDLDSLIKLDPNQKGVLIKIDCQGAEIPILKGASNIVQLTDFIILEIPLFGKYNEGVPSFLEHIKYMDSINFIPYEMLENHYSNKFNIQVDMMFINKNHKFNIDITEQLLINPNI